MSRLKQPLSQSDSTPLTNLLYAKAIEHGWTLEALGKAVGGHSWTVVSKILKGKMKIPMNKIEAYAQALKINPLQLLELAYPEQLEIIKRCLENDKNKVKE